MLRRALADKLPKKAADDRADVRAALTVLGRRPDHARERDGREIRPDLRSANSEGAELVEARLEGAHLQAANLGGAHLEGAGLTAAALRGAAVRSDLAKVVIDPDAALAQFAETWGHRTGTKLPEGVPIPDHWPDTDGYREWHDGWQAYKTSLGL